MILAVSTLLREYLDCKSDLGPWVFLLPLLQPLLQREGGQGFEWQERESTQGKSEMDRGLKSGPLQTQAGCLLPSGEFRNGCSFLGHTQAEEESL